MTPSPEVLVIGGGPAGAAVAARLAAAGRAVILCERQAWPRPQVCGEFISASALHELQALGIVPALLGAAEILRTRLVLQDLKADAGLPFLAYGLSRARLDASLLDLAARRGTEVRRGAGVRSLVRSDGGGWLALLSDGGRILSRTVVLASGKYELRGHQRVWKSGSRCVGFKMHWRLLPQQDAALGRGIELFLHPDGYAGLQPIDAGVANLCFVMDVATLQTLGASFAAALAHLRQLIPMLDERLRGATPLWTAPASVAGLPYGYVCRASDCAEGLYRVGDQLAVIPSFTGEGIAIALRTARLAADAIIAGVPPRDFVARARRQVRWPMRVAALLATMTRRAVFARRVLSITRCAGVLPILARATRLQARTIGPGYPPGDLRCVHFRSAGGNHPLDGGDDHPLGGVGDDNVAR
jgi:flavin-dependent dehydrogenase